MTSERASSTVSARARAPGLVRVAFTPVELGSMGAVPMRTASRTRLPHTFRQLSTVNAQGDGELCCHAVRIFGLTDSIALSPSSATRYPEELPVTVERRRLHLVAGDVLDHHRQISTSAGQSPAVRRH